MNARQKKRKEIVSRLDTKKRNKEKIIYRICFRQTEVLMDRIADDVQ